MEPKKDQRGCPPGQGTIEGLNGGRIGNPAHVWSSEIAAQIRTLAKVCSQELCAQAVGISQDTLQRHYRPEFEAGKREAIQAVGAKLLSKALDGHTAEMIFYLKTQGGWNTRIEHTGPQGGPIETRVDLSAFIEGKSEEELEAVERVLEALAAAGGIDVSGMLGVGAPASEERPA